MLFLERHKMRMRMRYFFVENLIKVLVFFPLLWKKTNNFFEKLKIYLYDYILTAKFKKESDKNT